MIFGIKRGKILRLKYISAMLTLTALLLVAFAPLQTAQAANGPVSDLQIFYYRNDTALYNALKAKDIDMSLGVVTPAQYNRAINDPDILLAPIKKLDIYAFSLNLNEEISDYPGVKNPLTVPDFRKAIHRLRDLSTNPFASPLPVPISAVSSLWYNASVVEFVDGTYDPSDPRLADPAYAYPRESLTFDRNAAKALLDAAGFTDPDGPGPGVRVYPFTWPQKAGQPLDPLVFSIRDDDALLKQAGMDLAREMDDAGIPVTKYFDSFASAYTRVMVNRNYHIYTAGWSVSRFPTYLYSWFHSSRWFPGGSNYHMSTTPKYTDVDTLVEKVWFPASYIDAITAVKNAQYLLTEKYTVIVPLWSSYSFYPYRSDMLSVTNFQAVGIENRYTYLKAWRIGGGPVRAGVTPPPLEVNQMYSRWAWEESSMNPFMEDFMSNPPYNIIVDQPSLLQDWSSPPGTWFDGAVEKSKLTYWFRDDEQNDGLGDGDAEWIEPVTGNVLDDFTPQWLAGGGYEFNSWYYASEPASWIYTNYRDIHHIRVYSAERKAEVYMNVKSYWSMYWPYGRLIYAPAWKQAPLSTPDTKVFTGPIAAGTSLALPYKAQGAPVEITSIKLVTANTFLTEASGANNNDYEMVLGKIKLYTAIPAGESIEVKYWARGVAAGYVPGGLVTGTNVGLVWIGAGAFYAREHFPGAGGWTTYTKNPHYWMSTPPTGELDFLWNWNPGPQPRTGYYAVDILDVIRSTWGLDGTGWAPPTPNWEPGTDLIWPGGAQPKGKTTVNDNTLVATDFGKVFGATP